MAFMGKSEINEVVLGVFRKGNAVFLILRVEG